MKKRAEAVYRGRVHGVGFRYAVIELSNQYPVTGYVRNAPDGSVEVVAEGEEADIKLFLSAIGAQMKRNIHGSTVSWLPYAGEFPDFGINYS